jgi:hypothetical protein
MHITERAESSVYSWTCSRRRFTPPKMVSISEIEVCSRSFGSVVAIVCRWVPLTRRSCTDSVLVVAGDVKQWNA